MAYDVATGTAVLFDFGQTWTWNGTTWTKQHPATSPRPEIDNPMAYDAATRTVVLLAAASLAVGAGAQTWTWDGTTWTQQHPAASPSPDRAQTPMAYDAATGTVVLFGGGNVTGHRPYVLGDTWTWDGMTWTRQHPATSPSPRYDTSMAYDAATGTVVVFGGITRLRALPHDTWTWG